jgi:ATP-dependent DNA helicase RecG
VVDEQHRFGVHQRLALSEKGSHADLLVMTATPIPRTLVLTHFGDMAVSILREKPRGRQPIDTAVLSIGEYGRVIQRLQSRIAEGAQAFWVCPLVEESEHLEVVAAEDRFAELQKVFGAEVVLIHGRMSATAKAEAMERFQRNEAKILVATTVIEVGVDVPNATIMIIEHAERFGLAQLHQLRGRVGRGSQRSACLLLYKEPLSETAKARLETVKGTEDGFVIAEKDLELRGQGDVLGTRQSGMPGYHLAVPDVHRHLLEWAHEDAKDALTRNPGLTGRDGDALAHAAVSVPQRPRYSPAPSRLTSNAYPPLRSPRHRRGRCPLAGPWPDPAMERSRSRTSSASSQCSRSCSSLASIDGRGHRHCHGRL